MEGEYTAGRGGEHRPLMLATAGGVLQEAELKLPLEALLEDETSVGASLFEGGACDWKGLAILLASIAFFPLSAHRSEMGERSDGRSDEGTRKWSAAMERV